VGYENNPPTPKVIIMPCGGCSKKPRRVPTSATSAPEGALKVTYTGDSVGTLSFRGRSTGMLYRFSAIKKTRWVLMTDLEVFRDRPEFRIVEDKSVEPVS
jgi:hypothetical protein